MKKPTARQLKYWNARLRTYRLGEHRARNTDLVSYCGNLRDTMRMTSITLTDDHDIAAMVANDDEFDDLT